MLAFSTVYYNGKRRGTASLRGCQPQKAPVDSRREGTLGDAENEIREMEILDLSFLLRIKESNGSGGPEISRNVLPFDRERGGGKNHHRDKIPHALYC